MNDRLLLGLLTRTWHNLNRGALVMMLVSGIISVALGNDEKVSCKNLLNEIPVPDSMTLIPYQPDELFYKGIYEKVTLDFSTFPASVKLLELDLSKAEIPESEFTPPKITERPDLSKSNWFSKSPLGKNTGILTVDTSLPFTRVFFKAHGLFANGRKPTEEEEVLFYLSSDDIISQIYQLTKTNGTEFAVAAVLGKNPYGAQGGLRGRNWLWISMIKQGGRHSVDSGEPMREIIGALYNYPEILRNARVILKLHSHPGVSSAWDEVTPGFSFTDAVNDNKLRNYMDNDHRLKHLVLITTVMQFNNLNNPYLINRTLYPLDVNVNRMNSSP